MAVPTEAYQSGFVQLPDFASTIQRGQQLGQQQQRLDLAAQKPTGIGDVTFKAPFDRDNQLLQGAANIAVNKSIEISAMPEGAEKQAEMVKVRKGLAQSRGLSNISNSYKGVYGKAQGHYMNPNSKFTRESGKVFAEHSDPSFWEDKNVVTDEYGYSTISGIPLEQYNFWNSSNIPRLLSPQEDYFKKSLVKLKTMDFTDPRGGFGGQIFLEDQALEAVNTFAESGLREGALSQEDVGAFRQQMFEAIRREDTYRTPVSLVGDRGKKDPKFTVTDLGVSFKMPQSGVDVAGGNIEPTEFFVRKEDGKENLMIIGNRPSKDAEKLYATQISWTDEKGKEKKGQWIERWRELAGKETNRTDPEEQEYREMNSQEDNIPKKRSQVEKYNSTEHGTILATLGFKNEGEAVDFINKANPKGNDKVATKEDIAELVGTEGYEGYTVDELVEYYRSQGYEIK